MQYPQIQFYRGSLVRLGSGQLKQVEDLSSDDFLESARLLAGPAAPRANPRLLHTPHVAARSQPPSAILHQDDSSSMSCDHQLMDVSMTASGEDEEEHIDVENDCSTSSGSPHNQATSFFHHQHPAASHTRTHAQADDERRHGTQNAEHEDDDEEELDVVSDQPLSLTGSTGSIQSAASSTSQLVASDLSLARRLHDIDMNTLNHDNNDSHRDHFELYIDSSVVRDFLEVGGPHSPPASQSPNSCPQTPSPSSFNFAPNKQQTNNNNQQINLSTNPNLLISSSSLTSQAQSVLIKFFLDSSRRIVFIEVPIEHPFFVYHRGWSSWDPAKTYEKFGLKCRKLKIGDTCISLIRKAKQLTTNESGQQQTNKPKLVKKETQTQASTHLTTNSNANQTTNYHHQNPRIGLAPTHLSWFGNNERRVPMI